MIRMYHANNNTDKTSKTNEPNGNTMTDNEHFATLRTLLVENPSKEGFLQIIELFEKWDEEETQHHESSKEMAIAYAQEHLSSWPDTHREATLKQCWPNFPYSQPSAPFELVHALNLSFNQIGVEGVKALANAPHLANLQTLELEGNRFGDEGKSAIANSPHLNKLTKISVD